jgi:cytochrome c553
VATLAALALAALLGGATVLVAGVVPIKASSGHWAITAALLDFAKVRSVATYSWNIEAPPLDDEALVVKGARHYESGCAQCHGAPSAAVPPVMAAMTPAPPSLTERISRFSAAELFTIVKHGIKFTGMPAWPALQRDDEVWAVVAFLQTMPALDITAYRRLAYSQPAVETPPDLPGGIDGPPPRAVAAICWRCHGVDGTGHSTGAFPSLAGQRAEYLYASLRAYADRQRYSGIMTSVAASLADDAMREVSRYYQGLPARAATMSGDASAAARGAALAAGGAPARDIPACRECHGPSEIPKNPAFPRLAGQLTRYLTTHVDLMHVFVDRLQPEDVRDVTAYFSFGTK